MLELLRDLLQRLGYQLIGADEPQKWHLFIHTKNNGGSSSSFVIGEISKISTEVFLVETQAEISQWLKSTAPAHNRAEKNCILILLLEHDYPEARVIEQVSEIEEDQYFFKKQVIFYKRSEIETLLNSLDKNSPLGSLENILYDRDRFAKYSNGNSDELYPLTARLFSKLPFLTVEQSDLTIPDLNINIQRQLEQKGLLELRDELLQAGSNESEIMNWVMTLLEKE